MAIAFPRSIRALGNDRFRPSLVTLVLTILFLLAWFGWFFFRANPYHRIERKFQGGTQWICHCNAACRDIAASSSGTKGNNPNQRGGTNQYNFSRTSAARQRFYRRTIFRRTRASPRERARHCPNRNRNHHARRAASSSRAPIGNIA